MKKPWDLEGTPLQIKTDSTPGSLERIVVDMYDKYNRRIRIVIVFSSPSVQYMIEYCTGNEVLPVQPPVEVDKIWTITKTETGIIIICNNVEVTNILFADSSESKCVPRMGGDVVEKIELITGILHGDPIASDFYRAGKLS